MRRAAVTGGLSRPQGWKECLQATCVPQSILVGIAGRRRTSSVILQFMLEREGKVDVRFADTHSRLRCVLRKFLGCNARFAAVRRIHDASRPC